MELLDTIGHTSKDKDIFSLTHFSFKSSPLLAKQARAGRGERIVESKKYIRSLTNKIFNWREKPKQIRKKWYPKSETPIFVVYPDGAKEMFSLLQKTP